MAGWAEDLRAAARSLARRPAFAGGVALTLGLGIGATTTIYGVVDGVLLRPLPYESAERLAAVGTTFPTREWADEGAGLQHLAGISMLNFRDYAARNRSFESIAAIETTSVLLPDRGTGPELVPAAMASTELFELLGASPAIGRLFLPEEQTAGDATSLLISHGAWLRRFGGDPGVVGVVLDRVGLPATIVGVLPADFRPPEAFFGSVEYDFWLPLQLDHARYADRSRRSLYLLGRLVEGVSVEVAREEARTIAADLAVEFPDGNVYPDGSWFGIGVNALHAQTVGTAAQSLGFFLGAAALLLLLAAMNAATLLLARGLDRYTELGVRAALGAGRARVVRLLLGEAGLLAVAGGVIGVAIAYGGMDAFRRYAPSSIPRVGDVSADARVLAVAAAVSLGTGLAAGLLPALRFSGSATWGRMRAARSVSEPGSRLRTTLVGGQVAVAVLLLSGAALLFSSFVRLRSIEPGFRPDGLVSLNIALKAPNAPDEAMWQAWDRALGEIASVPGVTSLAGTTNPPFQAPMWAPRILLPGEPDDTWHEGVAGYSITPGYIATLGARVVDGRDIERLDGPDAERVVLVNESFVRAHLVGLDPIDLILRHRDGEREIELRVVGVVQDMVQGRAEEGMRPAVYLPYTQTDWPMVQAVVRTDLPPEVIVPELRRAVARFNPVVPPRDVRTMRDRMADTRTTPRFQALLIGAFALVALLVAAAGLYASLSHAVGRRRRELGVRMALGARRGGVLRMVLGQGLRVAVVGLAVGLLGTLLTARALKSYLFEVEPSDPWALLGVSTTLLAVSALACILPARRATAVDPLEVMRSE